MKHRNSLYFGVFNKRIVPLQETIRLYGIGPRRAGGGTVLCPRWLPVGRRASSLATLLITYSIVPQSYPRELARAREGRDTPHTNPVAGLVWGYTYRIGLTGPSLEPSKTSRLL